MNIFEQSISILKSKIKLRNLCKPMHVEDVEAIIARLKAVYNEKLEEAEKEEKLNLVKSKLIKQIIDLMNKGNISKEDLDNAIDAKTKKRNIKRRTFCYKNVSGSEIYWRGSSGGRIPTAFRQYLNKTGKKREDCIVHQEMLDESA